MLLAPFFDILCFLMFFLDDPKSLCCLVLENPEYFACALLVARFDTNLEYEYAELVVPIIALARRFQLNCVYFLPLIGLEQH